MRTLVVAALAAALFAAAGCGKQESADFSLGAVLPGEAYREMQQAVEKGNWAALHGCLHPDFLRKVEKFCADEARRASTFGGDSAMVRKCRSMTGKELFVTVLKRSPTARSLVKYIGKPDGDFSVEEYDDNGLRAAIVTVRYPDGSRRLFRLYHIGDGWKYRP